jgi:N-acetylglutamate synthase-like GNAT family acetyltransferase
MKAHLYTFSIFLLSICLCDRTESKESSHLDEQIIHRTMDLKVDISHEVPSAEEYVALRTAAGLPPRSLASAEKGLKNSLFWITLRCQGQLIGMGRVVGDGGTVVQVTDIAVHPHYQKLGYGKLIFASIQEYILKEIPDDAFVCLFAKKEIASFYQNYGYCLAHEQWPGMYWPCAERRRIKSEARD